MTFGDRVVSKRQPVKEKHILKRSNPLTERVSGDLCAVNVSRFAGYRFLKSRRQETSSRLIERIPSLDPSVVRLENCLRVTSCKVRKINVKDRRDQKAYCAKSWTNSSDVSPP